MSAADAFEQLLRLAIVLGNTAAYRAGATCILRRYRMNVSAQSQRLPIKLGEEDSPALIENRTVETALLCNATAGLLNSSLRRCRHVLDLQVLSENFCVVLADFQRDLFDEITTDIGDMLMKPCNRGFLFAPILPELLHSCEPALHPSKLLKRLLECAVRLEERAVGKRTETDASHVDADTVADMHGRLHFVLGLNGNMPSIGLSGNRHILGFALDEAASLVFDPPDARQINLPSSLVNLEALRETEGVRGHELLVHFREGRQTFEELPEGARQILQRLLENLTVRFLKPGILFLPNQQFGAKLRIAEFKGRIRSTTLFVPCKSLVVHPARATGKAGHLSVLSSVGFQFERKALANNHANVILGPSKGGTMQNTDVRRGRHCVFMMHVHLVFVTKYRRARFSADQLGFLKDIFESVCKDFNAELVEMNGERDHVHLLVNYPPNVSVSKLVNSLKGVSSRMLRKQSQVGFERCFGSCLWSPSYFAASCGGAPLSIIKTYIENQETPS